MWLMMHGLGDSIEGYRWMPEVFDLPWMNYALVNAPDDYFGGYSWFDINGDMGPGIRRSRAALLRLLEELESKGYPAEKTVIGGFSQGCLMAVDVGLRCSKPPAGIVGISGWIFEPENLLSEMAPDGRERRLLMTHGTLDPIVPFAPVQAGVRELIGKGLSIEWHEFQKPHTIAGDAEVSVIRTFVENRFA